MESFHRRNTSTEMKIKKQLAFLNSYALGIFNFGTLVKRWHFHRNSKKMDLLIKKVDKTIKIK